MVRDEYRIPLIFLAVAIVTLAVVVISDTIWGFNRLTLLVSLAAIAALIIGMRVWVTLGMPYRQTRRQMKLEGRLSGYPGPSSTEGGHELLGMADRSTAFEGDDAHGGGAPPFPMGFLLLKARFEVLAHVGRVAAEDVEVRVRPGSVSVRVLRPREGGAAGEELWGTVALPLEVLPHRAKVELWGEVLHVDVPASGPRRRRGVLPDYYVRVTPGIRAAR